MFFVLSGKHFSYRYTMVREMQYIHLSENFTVKLGPWYLEYFVTHWVE